MTGNSVRDYNNQIITRKEPNPATVTPLPGTGRYGDVPLFDATKPGINWNGYKTYDPILNWGTCSSGLTSNSGVETPWYMQLFNCATIASGVLTTGFNLFKSGKSIYDACKGEEETPLDTNLAKAIADVDNIDKKTSIEEKERMLSSLVTYRNIAQRNLNTAKLTAETIERTLKNLTDKKVTLSDQIGAFDEGRSLCEAQIAELEAIPEDQRDTTKLAELKEKLSTEYAVEKRRTLQDQLEGVEARIMEQTLRLQDAQAQIDKLPDEIAEADKAIKKLDAKVTKVDYTQDDNDIWNQTTSGS